MTAAGSDWLLRAGPQPERITAAEYEALPEDICRTIEIVGGYVVFCESPSPDHQLAGRRLAHLVEGAARQAMAKGHPCLTVNTDVDVRMQDVPLHYRRPDVVLYRCLERERNERLRAEHVLLVAEITSPGTETIDLADKFAEYAKCGISHYWIVRLDTTGVSVIERYRLDGASMTYKHLGTFMKDEAGDSPEVTNPIPITIDWAQLEY